MGAFDGATKFFDSSLEQVAREYGYSAENILILSGEEATLRSQYPHIYENLSGCRHHADRRTPMQYAQDLVASWLIEDYYFAKLQSDFYRLSLDGADRNRNILPNSRVSSSSDYLISTPDLTIQLELMNDYTGFWSRQGTLHLRDRKFTQLQRSRSLFLAISITTREFTLFDFRQDIQAQYIPSHRFYGGKPAYELSIPRHMLQPDEGDRMVQAILAIL